MYKTSSTELNETYLAWAMVSYWSVLGWVTVLLLIVAGYALLDFDI